MMDCYMVISILAKKLMKATKYLFFVMLGLAAACSNDDPAPLSKKSVSLGSKTDIAVAPAGLTSSSDGYAQEAAAYIELVNGMTAYSSLLKAPSGAKKTATITPKNGRVSGETVTYTWSDSNAEMAYQVTESGDSYEFELMIKLAGSADWLRYLKAEEKKDQSQGSMVVYDVYSLMSNDASAELMKYEWIKTDDNINFKLTSGIEEFYLVLNINTKTKAGSIDYYLTGVRFMNYTWASDGHGTWTIYGDDGVAITESGEW